MLLRVQKLDPILGFLARPLENLDATVEEELTLAGHRRCPSTGAAGTARRARRDCSGGA
ncbi:MAG: hypothetical protein MZW92_26660 [Comamonadaceae bacterium]|nr:hypothetical protein [Comamonadaceae bacterium]